MNKWKTDDLGSLNKLQHGFRLWDEDLSRDMGKLIAQARFGSIMIDDVTCGMVARQEFGKILQAYGNSETASIIYRVSQTSF